MLCLNCWRCYGVMMLVRASERALGCHVVTEFHLIVTRVDIKTAEIMRYFFNNVTKRRAASFSLSFPHSTRHAWLLPSTRLMLQQQKKWMSCWMKKWRKFFLQLSLLITTNYISHRLLNLQVSTHSQKVLNLLSKYFHASIEEFIKQSLSNNMITKSDYFLYLSRSLFFVNFLFSH